MIKICLALVLSLTALASDQDRPIIYKFGKLMVAFERVDGLVVNRACSNKECEAYKKGKEFKEFPIPASMLQGGKNPRSVRCKQFMKGAVIIGLDIKGNEQSFCQFSDDSYLR